MKNDQPIPEGYMKNQLGHLVPIDQIDEITIQRNALLQDVFAAVQLAAGNLAQLKKNCNEESAAHIMLANGDSVSEEEASTASVTLVSFDGSLIWKIAQEPILIATERVVELQKLLRQAVEELPEAARKPVSGLIKAVVNLESGKNVDLHILKKMRLQKTLSGPSWDAAMGILDDCTEEVGMRKYHRFYVRDEEGNQQLIKLNFSAI